ncbi:MAG: hypothetical protein Q8850_02705 [Candidatus Phytoplasma australasiaticum]|nr:hypothetical protein [Candidatus Phytoplasma australasiaticum]
MTLVNIWGSKVWIEILKISIVPDGQTNARNGFATIFRASENILSFFVRN